MNVAASTFGNEFKINMAGTGEKLYGMTVARKRLIAASVILEFLGLGGAAVKAIGLLEFDLLGILAAAAATATAWLQAKQHQTLATAYGVTSQELAAVASEVAALTDEASWPEFVAKAEEAISREHTLWRASRGVHLRGRRS